MEGFTSIVEMRKNLRKTTRGVSGDTIFSAKAIYFIAYKVDELVKLQRKLKLSEYHLFMSYKLKAEKLPFDVAVKQWREYQETKET